MSGGYFNFSLIEGYQELYICTLALKISRALVYILICNILCKIPVTVNYVLLNLDFSVGTRQTEIVIATAKLILLVLLMLQKGEWQGGGNCMHPSTLLSQSLLLATFCENSRGSAQVFYFWVGFGSADNKWMNHHFHNG